MVHKVLEGLRDEAFELARDIGTESLTAPGGLRDFITKMRSIVFPRAAEEARELFRAGQRQGALARQSGESMLSYVSRRRRWWKLLKTLDSSIELSEPMRVELLLELSGLSRQESLVIKACTSDSRSFEAIGATLVEHYSGVHLKEGRSLGGGTFQDRRPSNFGARSRAGSKGYGKGKGKGFNRRAYIAEDEAQVIYDDAYHQDDEEQDEYDDTSYPALGDEPEYESHSYPAAEEDEETGYEDFELDEDEATVLNVLEELDPEEPESGHAIQLQLAANAALGKAKGRKGKGRGKGKSRGKVVRSHLTLEERRDKMKALKAKSKCLRCGGMGHWAGDPECKFPSQKGGKGGGKGRANLAIVTPKQDPDGGLYVPSGNDEGPGSYMVNELSATRPKSAPSQPSSGMQMEGGDRRFSHGQHKGQTYEEVSRKVEFVKWALMQPNPPAHLKDFLTWFSRYYAIQEGSDNRPYRETRASIGIPEGTYRPRPKAKGPKKVPPNPPLDRCATCNDFSYAGSSANFVRKTCRDCGHVSQERREHVYTVDPSVCSHEATDRRGSSRTTSRTFCRMCGTFVDEVPQEFHRERKAVSERILEATELALPVVQAVTADDATADLNPEAVEQIMVHFQDHVTSALATEQRVHPAVLHEWLRESIVAVMEHSPASPSWGSSLPRW